MTEQTERELFGLLQDIVADIKEIKATLKAQSEAQQTPKKASPSRGRKKKEEPTLKTESEAPVAEPQDPPVVGTLIPTVSETASTFSGQKVIVSRDNNRLYINGHELTDAEVQTVVANEQSISTPGKAFTYSTVEDFAKLLSLDAKVVLAILCMRGLIPCK